MKKIIAITAVTFMAATTAYAAEFTDIDLNADGYLSFEEAIATMPDMTEDQFKAIDVSLDGLIDQDEFLAADLDT